MQLHKKHGLNPTQSICPRCKKVKEVVLLGNSIKRKAKKKTQLDLSLCAECKQKEQEKTLQSDNNVLS